MNPETDPAACPLCGKENLCGALTGKHCWCLDAVIPRALIDSLPEESRGTACLCQKCVPAHAAP